MFFSSIRRKFQTGILLSTLVICANGCIYAAVAGLGALGGYVVSPDTVEGMINQSGFEEVWDAAVEVVSLLGVIEEQNKTGGVMIAKIQGAKVTIMAYNLSASSVKLSVKSRKAMLPKVKVSQDVYVKIVSYIEENDTDI